MPLLKSTEVARTQELKLRLDPPCRAQAKRGKGVGTTPFPDAMGLRHSSSLAG